MKKILLIALSAIALASCGKKTLIDERHTFDNNCWLRFEPEVYNFDVSNTDNGNSVILTLSYDTARLKLTSLPIIVNFFADSNEMHVFRSTLHLRSKNGQPLGESMGQYCTVTDTIDHYRVFNNKASYTFQIKQATPKYELYGVASLALKITEF